MKKFLIIGFIVCAVIAFFALGLDQLLTLDAIKERQGEFAELVSQSPVLVAAGFFILYVIVTALSLPGAAILTIASGFLFGLVNGVVIASFASSIGATLAFLASRYLFKKSVQERFGNRLGAINNGIEKEGAFYLFTLRLIPVFPFFLINLLMGLTTVRTWTFYWVSQVGMFLGTAVYVNAGTQLSKVHSLSGILSPGLLVSFILLGLFPLFAKKLNNPRSA